MTYRMGMAAAIGLVWTCSALGQQGGPLAAAPGSQTVAANLREGTKAFQARDFQRALDLARAVTSAEPANANAHNLAGAALLQLKDYNGAAGEFQQALRIIPNEYHNLRGLMEAYTLGGRTDDRDREHEVMESLGKAGKLPAQLSYPMDAFEVAGAQVIVTECVTLCGTYGFRYAFDKVDAQGQLVERVQLESDDVDQPAFRQEHPELAAKGERRYSLDSYQVSRSNGKVSVNQALYGFLDGLPPYDQVKARVIAIFNGKGNALGATTSGGRGGGGGR